MLNRKYNLLTALSLCLISISAQADTYSPYKLEVLQGLTQSADTVVTATIESVAPGQRGDIWTETTDTQVTCLVRDVYLGEKKLKLKTITVVFGAADEPINSPSESPTLLVLKKEGDRYRLCFFHTHGAFRLNGNTVMIWFEGKKGHNYYTLKEIVARVRNYSKSKVEMTTEVANNVSLSDGYLPVKFSFRNTGKSPVLLLPPSYCFSSLMTKRIVIDRRDAERIQWWSVDHWEFLRELEPLLKLEPGSERSYNYRIPFEVLHIDMADKYRVTFDYHPYQLSAWAKKAQITDKQMRQVWLGVPRKTRQIISIKSAE